MRTDDTVSVVILLGERERISADQAFVNRGFRHHNSRVDRTNGSALEQVRGRLDTPV